MIRYHKHRRSLAALSLVGHLIAGLLATTAHDHGGCCTPRPHVSASVTNADGPAGTSTDAAAKPLGCRHARCRHTHRVDAAQVAGPDTLDGWRSNAATHASLTAHCLACEFLAGAIAILPWTPSVGGTAARWRDAPLASSQHRDTLVTAFLARGPPVDAVSASATAFFHTPAFTHSGIFPNVQPHVDEPPRSRPPPGLHARRTARHDRHHRHSCRPLAA